MLRIAILLSMAVSVFAAEIDGKWTFTFQTPKGERSATVTITSKDEAVEIRYLPVIPALKGTFKNGTLEAGASLFAPEGGNGDFTMKGALKNGVIKGDASWNGNPLTFEAKRAS